MAKDEKKVLRAIIDRCRAPSKGRVRLNDYKTDWGGSGKGSKKQRRRQLESLLTRDIEKLTDAQDLLYAANSWAVLLIFQAMDAAGKDGTIKHVMSGVNPQGCQVYSFKHPSAEELDHDFLWRCTKALPERGRIGIFNRSYYEEVLVVKVHHELVAAQHIPSARPNKQFWKARYEDINQFEKHLTRNGTLILKFFLHVAKDEQRKRFLDRIDDPTKNWKFSPDDMAERRFWDEYTEAYEDCLTRTSTEWAPWYIVPADHKWATRTLVATILTEAIHKLDLKRPKVGAQLRNQIREARIKLQRKR